ncbi:MAG: hypothetical protein P8Y18_07355 [Candidatus Bathyarchaeota archaeon]
MKETTTCAICGCDLSKNEIFVFHDKNLCEDCHMIETHPVKVCNPIPVFTAKKIGNTDKDSTDILTDLQKAIHMYIKDNKKATIHQLCIKFNLTESNLTNQIAVLRHLELIKGKKEDNKIYFVPF